MKRYTTQFVSVLNSDSTAKAYQSALHQFEAWLKERQLKPDPKQVSSQHIEAFKVFLQNKGRKPATINKVMSGLNRFFNWALDEGIVKVNPVTRGSIASSEPIKPPAYLTKEERIKLLKVLDYEGNRRDKVIIMLMLYAGLRPNELIELNTDNIKAGSDTTFQIKIDYARMIPLNQRTSISLRNYLTSKNLLDTDFPKVLFYNRQNQKLTIRGLQYILDKYKDKTGFEKLNAHTLRHSYGYMLFNSTKNIAAVALMMGYKTEDGLPNIRTALKYISSPEQLYEQLHEEVTKAVYNLDE